MRYPIYLISFLAPWHRASERLLFAPIHAHGAEDGFRADGALGGPGLVAVRLLVVHLLLVVFTACGDTRQPRRGQAGQAVQDRGAAALAPLGGAVGPKAPGFVGTGPRETSWPASHRRTARTWLSKTLSRALDEPGHPSTRAPGRL